MSRRKDSDQRFTLMRAYPRTICKGGWYHWYVTTFDGALISDSEKGMEKTKAKAMDAARKEAVRLNAKLPKGTGSHYRLPREIAVIFVTLGILSIFVGCQVPRPKSTNGYRITTIAVPTVGADGRIYTTFTSQAVRVGR